MGMAQTTDMDRSAVNRTYGTSDLHIRGLIRTYSERLLVWPSVSTTCHFWVWYGSYPSEMSGSWVWIGAVDCLWGQGMDPYILSCGTLRPYIYTSTKHIYICQHDEYEILWNLVFISLITLSIFAPSREFSMHLAFKNLLVICKPCNF